MRVRFLTNIGSRDAGSMGLKLEQCTAGEEATVSDADAAALIDKGYAEVIGKPEKLKAVPKEAKVRGVPESEAFLKAYKEKEVSGD